jgi:hypothetical protein
VVTSTDLSGGLTRGTKKAIRALAILKISVMERPKIVIGSLIVRFETQHAFSTVLALHNTLGNMAGIEFAMRTTISCRTVTLMRFFFKAIDAGSSVGTKDIRIVSTFFRPLHFTVLANVRNSTVMGVGTIAKEVFGYDLVIQAVKAFASVITIVIRAFTCLVLAGAT